MPNTRLHFVIFPIYAVLLVKEMEFFSLFLLLGEIRRVLSGKMATNQLKISQKIDIDSFQCIDWHREVIKVTLCVNFMTNRHLNSNTKHCALVEIGLADLPKSGGARAPPAPRLRRA